MNDDIKAEDTLAVKYRANTLDDIVGQENVVSQIKGMHARKKIPRTLLITGDTGCGKTTLARIIANLINGFPATTKSHPDIVEINSGDKRRIDDVRGLLQQINFLPSSGKFKVYIVDECHTFTADSMRTLLKPLEEPPEHVVWILATNEPYKLPQTIRDRAEVISLRHPQPNELLPLLKRVCKKEKVFQPYETYSPLLKAVANASGGTPRAALSILGRLINIHEHRPIKMDEKNIDSVITDTMKVLDVNTDKVAVLILLSLYKGRSAALTAIGDTQDFQTLSMHLLNLHTTVIEKAANITSTWESYAFRILQKNMQKEDIKPTLKILAIIQQGLLDLRKFLLLSMLPEKPLVISSIASLLTQVRSLRKED